MVPYCLHCIITSIKEDIFIPCGHLILYHGHMLKFLFRVANSKRITTRTKNFIPEIILAHKTFMFVLTFAWTLPWIFLIDHKGFSLPLNFSHGSQGLHLEFCTRLTRFYSTSPSSWLFLGSQSLYIHSNFCHDFTRLFESPNIPR